jgi:hypothetical protein
MVERFLADGFVRIDEAFDRATADECVDRMWPIPAATATTRRPGPSPSYD